MRLLQSFFCTNIVSSYNYIIKLITFISTCHTFCNPLLTELRIRTGVKCVYRSLTLLEVCSYSNIYTLYSHVNLMRNQKLTKYEVGGGGGARKTVQTPSSNIVQNYKSAFKIKIGLKTNKIRGIIKRGVGVVPPANITF